MSWTLIYFLGLHYCLNGVGCGCWPHAPKPHAISQWRRKRDAMSRGVGTPLGQGHAAGQGPAGWRRAAEGAANGGLGGWARTMG